LPLLIHFLPPAFSFLSHPTLPHPPTHSPPANQPTIPTVHTPVPLQSLTQALQQKCIQTHTRATKPCSPHIASPLTHSTSPLLF
jgi:hypothetical protein